MYVIGDPEGIKELKKIPYFFYLLKKFLYNWY